MKIIDDIKKYSRVMTIVLALTGITLTFYYNYCDAVCSQLREVG